MGDGGAGAVRIADRAGTWRHSEQAQPPGAPTSKPMLTSRAVRDSQFAIRAKR